jgi:hypothetical protein
MVSSGLLVAMSLWLLQVPAPARDPSRELENSRRALAAREAEELTGLVKRVSDSGDAHAAEWVRRHIEPVGVSDGPTRFVPRAEIVPKKNSRPEGSWVAAFDEIQARSAERLFELARAAASSEPPSYGLASRLLRMVIDRQPDHPEARRLLGYVPHEGGWATPFAVSQIKKGNVSHPLFGWVPADWVAHLDRGELPAPSSRKERKARWLSREEADNLRADGNPPWHIFTEHFEIQTNVTLAEAIQFGRKLEAFHDLFTSLLADILGDRLPLALRFKDRAMTGEPRAKTHLVTYFASKDQYADELVPKYGPKIKASLGFYDPPKPGKGGRAPAYFFRDPDGQIPADATLYHEVSHQLLFENAGPNAYNKNVGNYWVFEGLGTYFESTFPRPDGSLEVGGLVGIRCEHAIRALIDRKLAIPIEEFVAMGEADFMRDDHEIFLRYQQAMVLTIFLMQWHDGVYRDGFLDYVKDAYRGRIKLGTGKSLRERVGQPYTTLDKEFLSFLRAHSETGQPSRPEAAASRSNGAIRTVPGH